MKFKPSRRFLLSAVFAFSATLAASLAPATAFAFDMDSPSEYNLENGLGIKGFDPVAYFTVGKPMKGMPEFTASFEGVKYQFASAESRDMFIVNPAKYAPQYGGFCAMAVANGVKLDGMPNIWTIYEGKLYLNVGPAIQKLWVSDIPKYEAIAKDNWPQIRKQTPKALMEALEKS